MTKHKRTVRERASQEATEAIAPIVKRYAKLEFEALYSAVLPAVALELARAIARYRAGKLKRHA